RGAAGKGPPGNRREAEKPRGFDTIGKNVSARQTVEWPRPGRTMTIRLWDVASGQQVWQFQDNLSAIASVTFSPDGQVVASGSAAGLIRLWDLPAQRLLRRLEGHQDAVRCLAYYPDGQLLASGGRDKTIRLWDVTCGEEIWQFEGHLGQVSSVAFTPD